SLDGGQNWTPAIHLAGPMRPTTLPLTNQGHMVGDYISTSVVAGRAYPAFAVATRESCSPIGIGGVPPAGRPPAEKDRRPAGGAAADALSESSRRTPGKIGGGCERAAGLFVGVAFAGTRPARDRSHWLNVVVDSGRVALSRPMHRGAAPLDRAETWAVLETRLVCHRADAVVTAAALSVA